MDPFTVLKNRGHILNEEPSLSRAVTHIGERDDYNLAAGPVRSLTARSDKQMQPRDYKMPVDLARSRRVGLSRIVCQACGSTKDQGLTHHAPWCPAPLMADRIEGYAWERETTGPLAPNQTSADVGWH